MKLLAIFIFACILLILVLSVNENSIQTDNFVREKTKEDVREKTNIIDNFEQQTSSTSSNDTVRTITFDDLIKTRYDDGEFANDRYDRYIKKIVGGDEDGNYELDLHDALRTTYGRKKTVFDPISLPLNSIFDGNDKTIHIINCNEGNVYNGLF